MDVTELEIPDVKILTPKQFGDSRGFFSETYNYRTFQCAGLDIVFVQDNHVYSAHGSTLRGLHFQVPPFAQDKLVRAVRGSVLDVAVDIRKGSPTYGRYVSCIISAKSWNQIYIPIGFAHGYLTLEPDTEVLYKVSNYYSPGHDFGLLWCDPDLGIDWQKPAKQVILSHKDKKQPLFKDFNSPFAFTSK